MSARHYAIVLLFSSAASAVVEWNSFAAVMAAACAAFILVGIAWKRVTPTLLAGCSLYAPFALALAKVLPITLSYLFSGIFVIALCERLTFEYDVSTVIGVSTGIDTRSRLLVAELSRAHAKKIVYFLGLGAVVIVGSTVASYFTVYASELTASAVLLMFAILVYAKR